MSHRLLFYMIGGVLLLAGWLWASPLALPRTETTPALVLAENITLRGNLAVYHFDDFADSNRSRQEYFLVLADGTELRLFFPEPPQALSGTTVKVRGSRFGSVLMVDPAAELVVEAEPPRAAASGSQRVLAFLVNFTNSPPEPFTAQRARELVFQDQVQRFYVEQSYGQFSFAGEVSEWLTVDAPQPEPGGFNPVSIADGSSVGQPLRDYIVSRRLNLNDYDHILYLPNVDYGAEGSASLGRVPITVFGQQYFLGRANVALGHWQVPAGGWFTVHPFTWRSLDESLAHEWGHNLGLYLPPQSHAQGLDCGEAALYGNCVEVNYGNYFDVMGWGWGALHFNAFGKEILGWFQPGEMLTIDRSGRYTINPLESATSTVKAAKVKFNEETPFYLEYRRGIGFDAKLNRDFLQSNQSGLFINNLESPTRPLSRLLDMSPTAAEWSEDAKAATLNGSNFFTDTMRQVVIGPVINASPEAITFDVQFNEPTYGWWPLY